MPTIPHPLQPAAAQPPLLREKHTQAAEGAGIPAAGAQLSLNKKDPLTTSPAVAVSQLGLCSGDLVFLLSDAHEGYAAVAPPAPRPTLVHSAAPPNRPSEVATASPAAMAASAAERRATAS